MKYVYFFTIKVLLNWPKHAGTFWNIVECLLTLDGEAVSRILMLGKLRYNTWRMNYSIDLSVTYVGLQIMASGYITSVTSQYAGALLVTRR